jgi:hypothetical protein
MAKRRELRQLLDEKRDAFGGSLHLREQPEPRSSRRERTPGLRSPPSRSVRQALRLQAVRVPVGLVARSFPPLRPGEMPALGTLDRSQVLFARNSSIPAAEHPARPSAPRPEHRNGACTASW